MKTNKYTGVVFVSLLSFGVGCSEPDVPEYLSYQPLASDNSGTATKNLCTYSNNLDAVALVEIVSMSDPISSCGPNELWSHLRVELEIVTVLRGSFQFRDTYILPARDGLASGMRGLVTLEDVESIDPNETGIAGFLPVTFLDSPPESVPGLHESVVVDLPASVEELRTELNSGEDHCVGKTLIPKSELDSIFVAGPNVDCGGR